MSDKTVTIEGTLGLVSGVSGVADAVPDVARVGQVSEVAEVAEVADLDPVAAVAGPSAMAGVSATAGVGPDPIAEIAAALDAGRLDPAHALELIIDHSMDELGARWLTPDERVAAREQVLALVAQDPHLAGLRARLGSVAPAAPDRGPQS